ncbi:unnamed protein product [Rhizopus stolonifer]
MFNMIFSLIFAFFDWIQSAVCFYIHLKSTLHAAFHIAQYDYEENVTERRTARPITYRQLMDYRSINPTTIKVQKCGASASIVRKRFSKKLPNELLIKIFSQLDQKDLFQCVSVSSLWNQLAIPLLWTSACPKHSIIGCTNIAYDENTNRHHHHVSSDFPLQTPRYGQSIVTLNLSEIASSVNDCTVRYVIRQCPRLRKLSLEDCVGITDESLRLLARSPVAKNLRAIILQNCRQITDTGLQYLAEHCQELEAVHIGGCELITNKGFNRLMVTNGKTICNLRINDCALLTGAAIQSAARHCGSGLKIADFSYLPFKHNDIVQLAIHCPNIVRLDLSMKKPARIERAGRALFGRLDNEQQIHEFGGLFDSLYYHQIRPNLSAESELHLERIMEQRRIRDLVSDRTVIHLSTHMKELVHLDVINWTCLTDNSVRFLTDSCSSLETLGLSGCSSITKTTHKYCRSLRSSYIVSSNK